MPASASVIGASGFLKPDPHIDCSLVVWPLAEPSIISPRRRSADCGEYRQAAGAIAQYKKAPTQTTGPSDYQQKINVRFQLLVL
jgi:hypothetical protein